MMRETNRSMFLSNVWRHLAHTKPCCTAEYPLAGTFFNPKKIEPRIFANRTQECLVLINGRRPSA
jgi:hypothetical protein